MERRKVESFKPYLAGPFVWMMSIPLVMLDLFIEIYHRICFPLYGVPLIKRANYIKIDRYKLQYLTLIEKVECAYCGYANGLLHYCVEIAAASEKYWCGIKHQQRDGFIPPAHHADFVEYGDKEAFMKKHSAPEKKGADKRVIGKEKEMIKLIKNKLSTLIQYCRKYQVQRLILFGSAAGDNFEPGSSNLDLLVEFQPMSPGQHAANYFDLIEDLEKLFGISVDLLEPGAIHNPYFKQGIEENQATLYEAA